MKRCGGLLGFVGALVLGCAMGPNTIMVESVRKVLFSQACDDGVRIEVAEIDYAAGILFESRIRLALSVQLDGGATHELETAISQQPTWIPPASRGHWTVEGSADAEGSYAWVFLDREGVPDADVARVEQCVLGQRGAWAPRLFGVDDPGGVVVFRGEEEEVLSVRFAATDGRSLLVTTEGRDEAVIYYEEETSRMVSSTRAGRVKQDASGVWHVVYFDPGGVPVTAFTRDGRISLHFLDVSLKA